MKRIGWIDALRIAAVVSIVGYHSVLVTANTSGYLTFPAIFVLAILQNEVLIGLAVGLASLRSVGTNWAFPLAWRVTGIYVAATTAYLLRNAVLGLNIWPNSFTDALLLIFAGGAEYHLHFFPALVAIVVILNFIPFGVLSTIGPIGLAVLAAVFAEYRVIFETEIIAAALTAWQLLLLHGIKTLAMLPVGAFALVLVSLPRRDVNIGAVLGLAFVGLIYSIIAEGNMGIEFARVLFACVALACVFTCKSEFDDRLVKYLAQLSLIIFVIHPAILSACMSILGAHSTFLLFAITLVLSSISAATMQSLSGNTKRHK